MAWKWKEWAFVHCAAFITFLISSLFFNFLLLVVYLTVRPFSLKLCRRISAFLVWCIHAQILFIGTHYSGSQCRVFGDPKEVEEAGKNHAIFIMNHHNEVDWLFAWMVADWCGVLHNGKVIAKKMIKYVPTIGWAWALTDMIFLDRSWERDRRGLKEGMDVLASYNQTVWMLLYPEGTRLNKVKLRQGQEFSKERGLPVYNHHLVPRTKGFSHIMKHINTDKFKYIYDVSMAVDETRGAEPTFWSILMGRPVYVNLHLRRISTEDVPKDPEGASQFLLNLFKEKDLLMESYYKSNCKSFTSHIPDEEKIKFPDHQPITVAHKIGPLINSLMLNALVCLPILYKLAAMVASGSLAQISIIVGLTVVAYFLLKSFIGLSKIKGD